MNIIERAARQLNSSSDKSLVEKAVERLGGTDKSRMPTPAPEVPLRQADSEPAHATDRRTRGMVQIDFDRLRASGFALPGDQSELAEELRLIKRPLLTTAFSRDGAIKNPNLIMVTSASPNEGKTFTATNLALSMASEHDVHVLLIDADVANPTIPRVFGFNGDVGLMDVVSNATDFADALFRTNIPNMSILPSGRPRAGGSELFASARMTRFIEEIAKRYPDRVVIFDSPPILSRSEAQVLARHVGQVVFVVEAECTSSAVIREALSTIGSKKPGGIVLNKMPAAAKLYGHYYANGAR
jgi:protein-tyrosine kinase